ncbi:MAG: cobalamin-dependent protein [Oscillospiraceae bacterium]|nr:cobalamin-dependent protein [Oscillospiraceae bacterium]
MFRVSLVRTFSQSEYKEPAEPLGIEALAAYLRQHEIECRLFDREIDSFGATVDAIAGYGPALIGFSVMMEDNAGDALKMMLKIKTLLPNAVFVVGGLFVTLNFERAKALFPSYSRLVVGEGELTLLNICFELMKKPAVKSGTAYLTPNEWPWMYRPDLEKYLNIGAPINMRTSRGCRGKCRFCATPFLPENLSKWEGREIGDLADEMADLCSKYALHAFNFVDDDFGPLNRVEQLIAELEKRNLRCAFSLQLRAAEICKYNSPDLCCIMKRLKNGGLSRVFIGLESFDEETLSYFNKKLNPEKTLESFKIIRRAGIAVHIGYILWHPLSTIESVKTEALRLWENGFFTTKIVMAKLQLFPGCGLVREEQNINLKKEIEEYYNAVTSKVAPLYDIWLIGAIDVPRQYSILYLEDSETAAERTSNIEKELSRLDSLTFAVLMDTNSVTDEKIKLTAEKVKERLYEFGCTFDCGRRSVDLT